MRSTSRFKSQLLALVSAGLLGLALPPAFAADAAVAQQAAPGDIVLPAKPSEMLRAPLSTWKPLLAEISSVLDDKVKQAGALKKEALITLHIQRTVLLQTQGAWAQALDAVHQAQRLQDTESGRRTAGLLNEILARQAQSGGDAAWLRQHLREQLLAAPWGEVGPVIVKLREQLAGMKAEDVEAYVTSKLDASAAFAKNRVDFGFAMQILAMRFQLLEVLPRRDTLVAALDDVIAQRAGASSR